MNFREIQNEALHLPERDRAELVQSPLSSLDSPAEDGVSMDWPLEAQRGAGEIDRNIVRPVPSREVARGAQPMDIAFPRSLEETLDEWASEADEEASREAIAAFLRQRTGIDDGYHPEVHSIAAKPFHQDPRCPNPENPKPKRPMR
uniref:Addiction module component n=1 Tax=Candidatus Kentrum eta TaxID=2126337 RepID=A0A450UP09_9GAMM|nr:MAG: hypothetical protein BECKH772A_GA0070896_100693 [Candidatus Kentron sp. H]VFJ94785.1 MAG: hypothetical protein BECKH772B_GA0070898_100673 [Candidatus Kentron sp. H]VFK01277.1 MAG: hypothetical protein BECKH772C_GA0070978_100623 [Candidatus Kentron sp. H]